MIKVYVFKSLPQILWGYTRDLRALWTLEECNLKYEIEGLNCGPQGLSQENWFEAISPFKQIPVIDDEGYVLPESGAILLYLAEKSGKLIASDLKGRAQVYRWLITSLSNVEIMTLPILMADFQGDSNPHAKAQRPWHVETLEKFLGPIDEWLSKQEFLVSDDFSVADIMFTCVLREIRNTEILKKFSNIEAYVRKCQERPAFVKVINEYEDRLSIPRGGAR